MATPDYEGLKTELKTNARYRDAYLGGSTNQMLIALRQPTGGTVAAIRTRTEVLDAVTPWLDQLTRDKQGALELIIGTNDSPRDVDFAESTKVKAIKDLWIGTLGVLDVATALDSISTRPAIFSDAFGLQDPSLDDVREAQHRDAESYVNRYKRGEV